MGKITVLSHRREKGKNSYEISLGDGRTVEVLYVRRFSRVEIVGGSVLGCAPELHVTAFREAADWLSRFVEPDGSPRPGFLRDDISVGDPPVPAVAFPDVEA